MIWDAAGTPVKNIGAITDVTERKRAQAVLRESEERYRDLVENSQDLICTHDLAGNVLSANEATAKFTGYSREALLRMNMAELIEPETQGGFSAYLAKTQAEGRTSGITRIRTASGETRYWEYACTLRTEGVANPIMRGMAHDITERKRAEEALRQSKALLQSIFRSAPVGIGLVRNRNLGWANERLEQMTGYSALEMIGSSTRMLYPTQEDYDYVGREKYEQIRARGTGTVETRWLRKDGRIIDVILSSTPLDYEDLDAGVVFTALDITERKRAEEALRESEAKFRTMVETLPLAIYQSVGIEQTSEYVNSTMIKLFGYTQEDIPTVEQWWPLAYPDETYRREISEEWTRRVKRTLETQSPIEPMEVVVTCKDGSTKDIAWGYIALRDKNYAYGLDLTERKQAEKALRESEERFRLAAECSNDFIYEWDIQTGQARYLGDIDGCLGYAPGEFPRKVVEMIGYVHPDDISRVLETIQKKSKHGKPYEMEYRLRRSDGTYADWLDCGVMTWDDAGNPIKNIGASTDITERKRAEEALRRSERRYRLLAENLNDVIWTMSVDGTFTYVSPSVFQLRGFTPEEVMQQTFEQAICPGSRTGIMETFRAAVEDSQSGVRQGVRRFEIEQPRKDGTMVWTEVTVQLILDEERQTFLILGVSRDITERKRAEEEKAKIEAQFQQAQKMESALKLVSLHAAGEVERKRAEDALHQANRARHVVAESNSMLVRVTDEEDLRREVCRIITEVGGYRLSWVGLAEHDEAKSIRVAAQHGFEAGYLDALKITWDDSEYGQSPAGTAIRTGQITYVPDIPHDPRFAPWRERVQQYGYASCVALPIVIEGETIGALMVYADTVDAFGDDEIAILCKLADNLAFGLRLLRISAERDHAEEALRTSEERFRLAAQCSNDVIYERDLRTGFAEFFGDIDGRLGYAPGAAPRTLAGWIEHIHSEDLSRVLETIEQGFQHDKPYGVEYRLRKSDGTYMEWSDSGVIIRDAAGNPVKNIGAATDITALKKAEEALRASEERFRLAAQCSSDVICERDLRTGLAEYFGDIDGCLGYAPGEFPRTLAEWIKYVHPDDLARGMEAFQQGLQQSEPFYEEYRLRRSDGTYAQWSDATVIIRDAAGNPVKSIGAASDTSESKRVMAELVQAKTEAERANRAKELEINKSCNLWR